MDARRSACQILAPFFFLLACAWTCSAAPQDPPSAPPAAAPSLTDTETETFLRSAKIESRKTIGTGITRAERAVLFDGKLRHEAHVQTIDEYKARFESPQGVEMNFKDSWKFNVAAYKLDRLLGLNMTPVSVERKVGGSTGSVTWWIDDAMMETDRLRKKVEPPDPVDWNNRMFLVRVFDQLIFNNDRNLQNLLITPDWKLWMIDHTRAFRVYHFLRESANLARCDRVLMERLRALDKKGLQTAIKPYLTGPEIDGVLARRDKIVKRFEELIAEKGESEVLYSFLK